MAIYDPVETDTSKQYVLKLFKETGNTGGIGLLGGWAVYLWVHENFRKATGSEYLGSRDIDVFIDVDSEAAEKLNTFMQRNGFLPSGYFFRYQLITERETGRELTEEESKKIQSYNLFIIFLDIFGNKESKELKLWTSQLIAEMFETDSKEVLIFENMPILVPSVDILLALKVEGFLGRENTEKKQKDAADIYALFFYSGELNWDKLKHKDIIRKSVDIMLSSESYIRFIAKELFGDELKFSLVKANLLTVLESLK
ncbi:MAG: hypothetical protein HY362_02960 [Candidatus Aenigmarchaeota archaeon]|nr:hypothetical protein [Candidatus Aenigmarchaeota archaeon]